MADLGVEIQQPK